MTTLSEQIENVLAQYEQQKLILENAGILLTFPDGEKGIIGIDGKNHILPSFDEVCNRARSKKMILEEKTGQGFTKLLITPFGVSLNQIHEKVAQAIVRHVKEGKFFATKKDPNDPNEALVELAIDENEPVWTWEKYKNADINGTLVYEVMNFSGKDKGKTKREMLEQSGDGWHISFFEDTPNLPREKEGKTMGKRTQFEANKSPVEYLALLQNEKNTDYANEQGFTPEDWAMYFLSHLEETNQIIDDYEGAGNVSWCISGYFPENSGVPTACFIRSVKQVRIGWLGARYFGPVYCARVLVRI